MIPEQENCQKKKQKKTSKTARAVQIRKKKTSTRRKTGATPSAPPRTDSSNTNTLTHTLNPQPTSATSTSARATTAAKRTGVDTTMALDPATATPKQKKKRATPNYNFQSIYEGEPSPPQSPTLPDENDPIFQPLPWRTHGAPSSTTAAPAPTTEPTTTQTHTAQLALRNFRYTLQHGLQYVTPPNSEKDTRRRSAPSPPCGAHSPSADPTGGGKRSRAERQAAHAGAVEAESAHHEQQQQYAGVHSHRA